jgi:prolyl-tRNA synthetase
MGMRVLSKVSRVIREEMDRAGALEVLLPVIHPQELWERSGRWTTFQPEPLKTRDRTGRWFLLAPTHEEAITDCVGQDVRSYRDLPVSLYQIQSKFRDEPRPRAGLIRTREFVMKDAYSFGADRAALDVSFEAMYAAYVRIFARLGLRTLAVEAEAGSIGGFDTLEFVAPSESGEDTTIQCDACGYASNLECARSRPEAVPTPGNHASAVVVATPGARTVEAVCAMLGSAPQRLIKTLLYKADDGFVAALVRGDRQLNQAKLARVLGVTELRMAEPEEVRALTGAEVGFSGPVGLPARVAILADDEIRDMADCVAGANQTDAHLVHVAVGRDFAPTAFDDLRDASPGDACAVCDGGVLRAGRGIEVGHVFKLGTTYSEALGAAFTDEHGDHHPIVMGCYGIGVSRCIAAIVEQRHDEAGIVWPREVAPFEVGVLLLDPSIPELSQAATALYERLGQQGLEVLLDDRDERPGVKFRDADLVGYPVTVVVGKKLLSDGQVEVRRRGDRAELVVTPERAAEAVANLLSGA